MKSIRTIQDGREALWRITEADRENLFRLLFHRYPDNEWGTFFRFGFRRTLIVNGLRRGLRITGG